MFGHESKPSKIYSFGCKPPHRNAALVDRQMRDAHRYRNKLVELERARRERVEAAIRRHDTRIAELDGEIEAVDQRIAEHRAEIKRGNQQRRKREVSGEQRETIGSLKQRLRELRRDQKRRRKAAFESCPSLGRIEAESLRDRKRARAESGLYNGTYLAVEQATGNMRSGAPPKFKVWRGDGKLGLQLRNGLSEAEARSGESRNLVIEADPAPNRSGRRAGNRHLVHLRVGSDGRDPIWATVRAELHRPLPAGCQIKWVYLIRRRCGAQMDWRVQFVVASEHGFGDPQPASSGMVALDVGWRIVECGLRVAYWTGDDGEEGEVVIPERELGRWTHPPDLRSLIDERFNVARDELADWLGERSENPDWLTERTRHLRQWRSPRRLAGLVRYWADHRFRGDEEIFDYLQAWRRRWNHLDNWAAHEMRKAAAWRDDLYRRIANELAGAYRTIVIENTNWHRMARGAEPEDDADDTAARTYRRVASVGRLLELIRERASEVRSVEAAWTTQTCHACGESARFDAASKLHHTCSTCGSVWDQDLNAARNLLAAASGEAVGESR